VSARRWFAVEITVAPHASDAIEHCLNELGALGTEIDQLRKKSDEDITVVGYFEVPPEETNLQEQLKLALNAFGFDDSVVRSVKRREVEDADWLSEWKKHWRPTRVGRFLIAPNWYEVDKEPDTILIRIEPNMAFGTGTHETTQLCLKAIDDLYQPEMSFLDVGTGTGILAIAAAKVQRISYAFTRDRERANSDDGNILAVELDADSVRIARENAETNEVGHLIEFVHGTPTDDMPSFDFVCANLTLDVISPVLSMLVEKSRFYLVLSGVLAEQETQIVEELRQLGVSDLTVERDGEWIAVITKR
jgi:ribosomal protein L11 methyltransferase